MKKSEKYLEAQETVDKDLWPHFEALVKDYKFIAEVTTGSSYYISYKCLAHLINSGWRNLNDKEG